MTTEVLPDQTEVTFDQFREEWLQEFTEERLSSIEKGRRFAFKIVTQWLDVNEDDEDLVMCDGSGDGGIDIAYLRRSDVDTDGDKVQDSQSVSGDTWYLFQSKYGSAFQGPETILMEGQKVIATLTEENGRLSESTRQLLLTFTKVCLPLVGHDGRSPVSYLDDVVIGRTVDRCVVAWSRRYHRSCCVDAV